MRCASSRIIRPHKRWQWAARWRSSAVGTRPSTRPTPRCASAPTKSMVYRRSEREMPAFRFEYENAKLEGVRFRFQTQPIAIHRDALECVRVELGAPDESGRRRPETVPDSNFRIECDMVIPAIGQSRFLKFLSEFRGIELCDGNVVVDPRTGRTSNPRYYAGGDCVNGGREVVDAVAEGKRAAQGIRSWVTTQHG